MENNKLKKRIYVIISIVIQTIVILFCSLIIVRSICYSPIVVDGESMYPTLTSGDYGYCIKTGYSIKKVKRFDIVVFSNENLHQNEVSYLIKRVIGLPNEKIYFSQEGLFINDQLVEQNFDYVEDSSLYSKTFYTEDNYFVLGDNRRNSLDSRNSRIGNVSINNITGILKVITEHYYDINDLSKGRYRIQIRFY